MLIVLHLKMLFFALIDSLKKSVNPLNPTGCYIIEPPNLDLKLEHYYSIPGSDLKLTPENGFMIMEADFYNTYPQNGVIDGDVGVNPINAQFTIGPIDLSSSETKLILSLDVKWLDNKEYFMECYTRDEMVNVT